MPADAVDQLRALFLRDSLPVEKKSKNGMTVQDIKPMIRSLEVLQEDDWTVCLEAVICAQNPALNPDLLAKAIRTYLPELAPDFAKSMRLELYDREGAVFR